jgi:hypothetical protein
MSAGTLVDIADAVVTALADHFGASLGITVQRILDTELKLEDAEVLHFDVVPGGVKSEVGTRDTQRGEYSIDIALRKVFDVDDKAEVDAMFLLLKDIDAYLFDLKRLPEFEAAAWLTSAMRYPYVPAMLRANRQYTGLLTVTYLVFD